MIKTVLAELFAGVTLHPLIVKEPKVKVIDFSKVNSFPSGSFFPQLQLIKMWNVEHICGLEYMLKD